MPENFSVIAEWNQYGWFEIVEPSLIAMVGAAGTPLAAPDLPNVVCPGSGGSDAICYNIVCENLGCVPDNVVCGQLLCVNSTC